MKSISKFNSKPTRIDVLGIKFDPVVQDEIEARLKRAIRQGKGKSFVYLKPYVEFFRIGRHRLPTEVTKLLSDADLVVADGISIQWASAYLADKQPTIGHWLWSWIIGINRTDWLTKIIPERGAGVDTTQQLLHLASTEGWRIGIIGGPADNSATHLAVKKLWPKLQLVNVWTGFYSSANESSIVDEITEQNLDILFVAMGFWRQESFIARHPAGLAKVLIGEGGSFDYDQLGGNIARAPISWRRFGMEWLWRLIQQPSRLKRQLGIPLFMWRVYLTSRRRGNL